MELSAPGAPGGKFDPFFLNQHPGASPLEQPNRWFVAVAGSLAVLYGVVVLGFLATSPDLRLRVLLLDDDLSEAAPPGVKIRMTPGLQCNGPRPEAGDVLLRVGDHSTRTFFDFTKALFELHGAPLPVGGSLDPGSDPLELVAFSLPTLVQPGDGPRLVEIEFWDAATEQTEKTWLPIHSVPIGEILVSIAWFLLQLGVGVIGFIALWNRPYDRDAGLFCLMCIVALAAFVAGGHWWILAAHFWLILPFAFCAMLLPVVVLHFFLAYPRPQAPLEGWPQATLYALYAVPVLATLGFLAAHAYGIWLVPDSDKTTTRALRSLYWLESGIDTYIAIAGGCFGLTLIAIGRSLAASRNQIERSQLRWIWYAGLVALAPVGLALYLAFFEKARFAFGGARIPMYLASLSFMLAYAVGIVRHKLMLVDQIDNRGVVYYLATFALTLAFGLAVVSSSLIGQIPGVPLNPQQTLTVVGILILLVVLLLWLRDFFQRLIDRQFFREKYRLDRALQRMHQAMHHLVDADALGELMLASCRDALGVERAAFFFRRSPKGSFVLVASTGPTAAPVEFTADESFLDALQEVGSLQRVSAGTRSALSPVQMQLHDLQADLVHALELEGKVAGIVALGGKRNGTPYSAEDLTFLNALGQITHVALHGSKIHRQISRLNEDIQSKLDTIAGQNRQIAMLQAELTALRDEKPAATATGEPAEFHREVLKGNSPTTRRVLETVRKVARSESSVLIRGESGTGKELLARVIHDNSGRHEGPLVSVHCASLSAGLLESELFGHVKGAFTGAHQDKVGRFEAANGGTLFLDEIGDISLETQIKLLRVLQERSFEPVGSTQTRQVDVRLITATHQNLEQLIADGRFREDLYYRLNVISVTMPPLRDRIEDILELGLHFLARANSRSGKRITHIDGAALAALERHTWPGNVRELENAIERAVVLAEGTAIMLPDLPSEIIDGPATLPNKPATPRPSESYNEPQRPAADLPQESQPDSTPTLERDRLQDALRQCDGNKAQAARLLGMPRSTYYSKLQKYAIEPEPAQAGSE